MRAGSSRSGARGWVTLFAALLALGLVTDHLLGPSRPLAATPVSPLAPSLASSGDLASTWFCPALGANGTGPTRGRVIVANLAGTDLHVSALFAPSVGSSPPPVARVVAPYTRTTFRLEDEAQAPFTATTVTADGLDAAVDQEVQGPLGESITECTRASSDRWYFAAGRTDAGSTLQLSLFNPYPGPAVADLRFATDQGPTSPEALQGIVVPGRGVQVVDVGASVRGRRALATTVTVRIGRLIVDKLQLQGGDHPSGLSLTLGATAPGTTWYFADGLTSRGRTEHFEVYNPGAREAQVQLAPTLDHGTATPFELTVAPAARVSLGLGDGGRAPADDGQSWVAASVDDVPVVVERVMEVGGSRSLPRGVADTLGAPAPSRRWVFPAGSATGDADEYLIVSNPGRGRAHVDVMVSGEGHRRPLPGVSPLVIPARSRRVLRIGELVSEGVVVLDVSSDVAVVAERAQLHHATPGLSSAIGIAGG